MEAEYGTDIGQMAKLITAPNAITTTTPAPAPASFVQVNEASPTSLTTTIAASVEDRHDKNNSSNSSNETSNVSSSKTAEIAKAPASIDATKNNVQDTGSILMDSPVSSDASSTDGPNMMKNGNANANAQRVSINDVTNGPTIATDAIVEEDATKSPAISTSTSANIIKVNDRSRVVSKDDIESIRGRALNFTSNEHQAAVPGGVIYVTAPPSPSSSPSPSAAAEAAVTIDELSRTASPAMPEIVKTKSGKAKSFGDDLSDVSMDNDGFDFHGSEQMMTTTTTTTTTMAEMKTTTLTPLIHDSQCQSKVRFLNNLFHFLRAHE